MNIHTIGVYGFTADSFVRALQRASVTALVDIRQRRAVRGSKYSFANATALQSLLGAHGISYIAEHRLAPTSEIRDLQKRSDTSTGIPKRERAALAPSFVDAYATSILLHYSEADLAQLLARAGDRPCLFCIEQLPSACHRGIAAKWMAEKLSVAVTNIIP